MSKINTRRVCDTQKITYFAKKMAKIATLRTIIRARVYAHFKLRYKKSLGFFIHKSFGFVLRYIGAGRKPKADDRAIRKKRRYVTQTLRVCVPDPYGVR